MKQQVHDASDARCQSCLEVGIGQEDNALSRENGQVVEKSEACWPITGIEYKIMLNVLYPAQHPQ
jgi:hypothetical protein